MEQPQQDQVRGHTRSIIASIFALGVIAALAGSWLLYCGFQSGELLVQISGQAVAGLLGFLGGGKMMQSQFQDSIKISNPPSDPVQVEETH